MGRHPDPNRRAALLEATADYLLRHGLAQTMLRPIAAELGTSPRMLIYHFGSKEQLIQEALEVARDRQVRLFAGWFAPDPRRPYAEVLADGWRKIEARQTVPYLRLFQELASQSRIPGSVYEGFAARAVLEWLPLIEQGFVSDGHPDAGAKALATLTVATIRGHIQDLLATDDRRRVRAGFDRFVELIASAAPVAQVASDKVSESGGATGPVLHFDEAASRRVEASYTTADVVEQRRVVRAALDLQPGEDVLDIGSGPGWLVAEIALEVGTGGSVCGIDPSDSMLAIARRRELAPSASAVTFLAGDAGALPFADASFDVVVATQVYEYVEDMPAALSEAHRVLRPRGRLLVLDTDWDSIVWHSSDPARMQRVLAAWDQHLVDPHLPRRLGRLLGDAGFTVTQRKAVPLLNAGYDVDNFSSAIIGIITAFVPGRNGITKSEVTAWAEDLVALRGDYFFSLNRYVFVAVK